MIEGTYDAVGNGLEVRDGPNGSTEPIATFWDGLKLGPLDTRTSWFKQVTS
jgi:hypothetical protein